MFVEDLTVFFADFAVDATLGGVPVRGLLDSAPVMAFDTVAGSNPIFTLPTGSVTGDPRALALIVSGGATYTVRDWNDDGHGVTTLQLEAT